MRLITNISSVTDTTYPFIQGCSGTMMNAFQKKKKIDAYDLPSKFAGLKTSNKTMRMDISK